MSGQRKSSCEGRFPQLRSDLEEALMVTGSDLTEANLGDIYHYVEPRMYQRDQPDNYFQTGQDQLRPQPAPAPLSLIPLLAKYVAVPQSMREGYLLGITPLNPTAQALAQFGSLDLTSHAPKGSHLKTNFGIGGRPGDAIVSDAPFSIELWVPVNHHHEHAATASFWYRSFADRKVMLIDQLQSARTNVAVDRPEAQALEVAISAATELGFDEMWMYPAQKHPLFIATPERKSRFIAEFMSIYDENALAQGFTGDPLTYFSKKLR